MGPGETPTSTPHPPLEPDDHGFAAAVQMAEEAFWHLDLATGRLRTSDHLHRILGLPQDEPDTDWRRHLHHEDVARVSAELDAIRDAASPGFRLECRLRHQDGTEQWVRIRGSAARHDGRPSEVHGTLVDISEQRRTQDVFERLVRHNALILNAAGDGIFCMDAAERATFVNPAAARHLGSTVGELTGRPLCRFREGCTGEDGAPRHAQDCPVKATLETGRPHRVYDGRFRRADGSGFPVEYVVSPIREHGRVSGVVVVFEDASERRWSEDEIRRERRFSDGLIKSSIGGIIAFDKETRITIWNPAMEAISGLRADEVIGRRAEEAFPFLGETGEIEHLHAALRGEAIRAKDRPFRVDDTGRSGFFDARYAPLHDDDGAILGGLIMVHDTTDQHRREAEIRDSRDRLVRSEKLAALGTLVSGVGHELRTPMSYINNHLYLLKMLGERMKAEDPDMTPIADEIIRRVTSSMGGITRMSTLLDDLRATYRSGATEAKEIDLKDAVDEAVRLFSGAYEGPVQIEKSLDPTGPLLVESGRIQQIVINLLSNATDAMPDGGTVRVRVGPSDGGGEIVVSDTGTGMPEDVRANVFAPFYTTKRHGSGLGLYLVKQIVDRHMGQITCESTVGQGTTFRIVLPRHEADQAEEAVPSRT